MSQSSSLPTEIPSAGESGSSQLPRFRSGDDFLANLMSPDGNKSSNSSHTAGGKRDGASPGASPPPAGPPPRRLSATATPQQGGGAISLGGNRSTTGDAADESSAQSATATGSGHGPRTSSILLVRPPSRGSATSSNAASAASSPSHGATGANGSAHTNGSRRTSLLGTHAPAHNNSSSNSVSNPSTAAPPSPQSRGRRTTSVVVMDKNASPFAGSAAAGRTGSMPPRPGPPGSAAAVQSATDMLRMRFSRNRQKLRDTLEREREAAGAAATTSSSSAFATGARASVLGGANNHISSSDRRYSLILDRERDDAEAAAAAEMEGTSSPSAAAAAAAERSWLNKPVSDVIGKDRDSVTMGAGGASRNRYQSRADADDSAGAKAKGRLQLPLPFAQNNKYLHRYSVTLSLAAAAQEQGNRPGGDPEIGANNNFIAADPDAEAVGLPGAGSSTGSGPSAVDGAAASAPSATTSPRLGSSRGSTKRGNSIAGARAVTSQKRLIQLFPTTNSLVLDGGMGPASGPSSPAAAGGLASSFVALPHQVTEAEAFRILPEEFLTYELPALDALAPPSVLDLALCDLTQVREALVHHTTRFSASDLQEQFKRLIVFCIKKEEERNGATAAAGSWNSSSSVTAAGTTPSRAGDGGAAPLTPEALGGGVGSAPGGDAVLTPEQRRARATAALIRNSAFLNGTDTVPTDIPSRFLLQARQLLLWRYEQDVRKELDAWQRARFRLWRRKYGKTFHGTWRPGRSPQRRGSQVAAAGPQQPPHQGGEESEEGYFSFSGGEESPPTSARGGGSPPRKGKSRPGSGGPSTSAPAEPVWGDYVSKPPYLYPDFGIYASNSSSGARDRSLSVSNASLTGAGSPAHRASMSAAAPTSPTRGGAAGGGRRKEREDEIEPPTYYAAWDIDLYDQLAAALEANRQSAPGSASGGGTTVGASSSVADGATTAESGGNDGAGADGNANNNNNNSTFGGASVEVDAAFMAGPQASAPLPGYMRAKRLEELPIPLPVFVYVLSRLLFRLHYAKVFPHGLFHRVLLDPYFFPDSEQCFPAAYYQCCPLLLSEALQTQEVCDERRERYAFAAANSKSGGSAPSEDAMHNVALEVDDGLGVFALLSPPMKKGRHSLMAPTPIPWLDLTPAEEAALLPEMSEQQLLYRVQYRYHLQRVAQQRLVRELVTRLMNSCRQAVYEFYETIDTEQRGFVRWCDFTDALVEHADVVHHQSRAESAVASTQANAAVFDKYVVETLPPALVRQGYVGRVIAVKGSSSMMIIEGPYNYAVCDSGSGAGAGAALQSIQLKILVRPVATVYADLETAMRAKSFAGLAAGAGGQSFDRAAALRPWRTNQRAPNVYVRYEDGKRLQADMAMRVIQQLKEGKPVTLDSDDDDDADVSGGKRGGGGGGGGKHGAKDKAAATREELSKRADLIIDKDPTRARLEEAVAVSDVFPDMPTVLITRNSDLMLRVYTTHPFVQAVPEMALVHCPETVSAFGWAAEGNVGGDLDDGGGTGTEDADGNGDGSAAATGDGLTTAANATGAGATIAGTSTTTGNTTSGLAHPQLRDYLLLGTRTGNLLVVDVKQLLQRLPQFLGYETKNTTALGVLGDEHSAYAGYTDMAARTVRAEVSDHIAVQRRAHESVISSLSIGANGLIVTGSLEGDICISRLSFIAASVQLVFVRKFAVHESGIRAVRAASSQQMIVALTASNRAYLYGTANQNINVELYDPIAPHYFPIVSLTVVEELDQVLTADASGYVKVWSMQRGMPTTSFYALQSQAREAKLKALGEADDDGGGAGALGDDLDEDADAATATTTGGGASKRKRNNNTNTTTGGSNKSGPSNSLVSHLLRTSAASIEQNLPSNVGHLFPLRSLAYDYANRRLVATGQRNAVMCSFVSGEGGMRAHGESMRFVHVGTRLPCVISMSTVDCRVWAIHSGNMLLGIRANNPDYNLIDAERLTCTTVSVNRRDEFGQTLTALEEAEDRGDSLVTVIDANKIPAKTVGDIIAAVVTGRSSGLLYRQHEQKQRKAALAARQRQLKQRQQGSRSGSSGGGGVNSSAVSTRPNSGPSGAAARASATPLSTRKLLEDMNQSSLARVAAGGAGGGAAGNLDNNIRNQNARSSEIVCGCVGRRDKTLFYALATGDIRVHRTDSGRLLRTYMTTPPSVADILQTVVRYRHLFTTSGFSSRRGSSANVKAAAAAGGTAGGTSDGAAGSSEALMMAGMASATDGGPHTPWSQLGNVQRVETVAIVLQRLLTNSRVHGAVGAGSGIGAAGGGSGGGGGDGSGGRGNMHAEPVHLMFVEGSQELVATYADGVIRYFSIVGNTTVAHRTVIPEYLVARALHYAAAPPAKPLTGFNYLASRAASSAALHNNNSNNNINNTNGDTSVNVTNTADNGMRGAGNGANKSRGLLAPSTRPPLSSSSPTNRGKSFRRVTSSHSNADDGARPRTANWNGAGSGVPPYTDAASGQEILEADVVSVVACSTHLQLLCVVHVTGAVTVFDVSESGTSSASSSSSSASASTNGKSRGSARGGGGGGGGGGSASFATVVHSFTVNEEVAAATFLGAYPCLVLADRAERLLFYLVKGAPLLSLVDDFFKAVVRDRLTKQRSATPASFNVYGSSGSNSNNHPGATYSSGNDGGAGGSGGAAAAGSSALLLAPLVWCTPVSSNSLGTPSALHFDPLYGVLYLGTQQGFICSFLVRKLLAALDLRPLSVSASLVSLDTYWMALKHQQERSNEEAIRNLLYIFFDLTPQRIQTHLAEKGGGGGGANGAGRANRRKYAGSSAMHDPPGAESSGGATPADRPSSSLFGGPARGRAGSPGLDSATSATSAAPAAGDVVWENNLLWVYENCKELMLSAGGNYTGSNNNNNNNSGSSSTTAGNNYNGGNNNNSSVGGSKSRRSKRHVYGSGIGAMHQGSMLSFNYDVGGTQAGDNASPSSRKQQQRGTSGHNNNNNMSCLAGGEGVFLTDTGLPGVAAATARFGSQSGNVSGMTMNGASRVGGGGPQAFNPSESPLMDLSTVSLADLLVAMAVLQDAARTLELLPEAPPHPPAAAAAGPGGRHGDATDIFASMDAAGGAAGPREVNPVWLFLEGKEDAVAVAATVAKREQEEEARATNGKRPKSASTAYAAAAAMAAAAGHGGRLGGADQHGFHKSAFSPSMAAATLAASRQRAQADDDDGGGDGEKARAGVGHGIRLTRDAAALIRQWAESAVLALRHSYAVNGSGGGSGGSAGADGLSGATATAAAMMQLRHPIASRWVEPMFERHSVFMSANSPLALLTPQAMVERARIEATARKLDAAEASSDSDGDDDGDDDDAGGSDGGDTSRMGGGPNGTAGTVPGSSHGPNKKRKKLDKKGAAGSVNSSFSATKKDGKTTKTTKKQKSGKADGGVGSKRSRGQWDDDVEGTVPKMIGDVFQSPGKVLEQVTRLAAAADAGVGAVVSITTRRNGYVLVGHADGALALWTPLACARLEGICTGVRLADSLYKLGQSVRRQFEYVHAMLALQRQRHALLADSGAGRRGLTSREGSIAAGGDGAGEGPSHDGEAKIKNQIKALYMQYYTERMRREQAEQQSAEERQRRLAEVGVDLSGDGADDSGGSGGGARPPTSGNHALSSGGGGGVGGKNSPAGGASLLEPSVNDLMAPMLNHALVASGLASLEAARRRHLTTPDLFFLPPRMENLARGEGFNVAAYKAAVTCAVDRLIVTLCGEREAESLYQRVFKQTLTANFYRTQPKHAYTSQFAGTTFYTLRTLCLWGGEGGGENARATTRPSTFAASGGGGAAGGGGGSVPGTSTAAAVLTSPKSAVAPVDFTAPTVPEAVWVALNATVENGAVTSQVDFLNCAHDVIMFDEAAANATDLEELRLLQAELRGREGFAQAMNANFTRTQHTRAGGGVLGVTGSRSGAFDFAAVLPGSGNNSLYNTGGGANANQNPSYDDNGFFSESGGGSRTLPPANATYGSSAGVTSGSFAAAAASDRGGFSSSPRISSFPSPGSAPVSGSASAPAAAMQSALQQTSLASLLVRTDMLTRRIGAAMFLYSTIYYSSSGSGSGARPGSASRLPSMPGSRDCLLPATNQLLPSGQKAAHLTRSPSNSRLSLVTDYGPFPDAPAGRLGGAPPAAVAPGSRPPSSRPGSLPPSSGAAGGAGGGRGRPAAKNPSSAWVGDAGDYLVTGGRRRSSFLGASAGAIPTPVDALLHPAADTAAARGSANRTPSLDRLPSSIPSSIHASPSLEPHPGAGSTSTGVPVSVGGGGNHIMNNNNNSGSGDAPPPLLSLEKDAEWDWMAGNRFLQPLAEVKRGAQSRDSGSGRSTPVDPTVAPGGRRESVGPTTPKPVAPSSAGGGAFVPRTSKSAASSLPPRPSSANKSAAAAAPRPASAHSNGSGGGGSSSSAREAPPVDTMTTPASVRQAIRSSLTADILLRQLTPRAGGDPGGSGTPSPSRHDAQKKKSNNGGIGSKASHTTTTNNSNLAGGVEDNDGDEEDTNDPKRFFIYEKTKNAGDVIVGSAREDEITLGGPASGGGNGLGDDDDDDRAEAQLQQQRRRSKRPSVLAQMALDFQKNSATFAPTRRLSMSSIIAAATAGESNNTNLAAALPPQATTPKSIVKSGGGGGGAAAGAAAGAHATVTGEPPGGNPAIVAAMAQTPVANKYRTSRASFVVRRSIASATSAADRDGEDHVNSDGDDSEAEYCGLLESTLRAQRPDRAAMVSNSDEDDEREAFLAAVDKTATVVPGSPRVAGGGGGDLELALSPTASQGTQEGRRGSREGGDETGRVVTRAQLEAEKAEAWLYSTTYALTQPLMIPDDTDQQQQQRSGELTSQEAAGEEGWYRKQHQLAFTGASVAEPSDDEDLRRPASRQQQQQQGADVLVLLDDDDGQRDSRVRARGGGGEGGRPGSATRRRASSSAGGGGARRLVKLNGPVRFGSAAAAGSRHPSVDALAGDGTGAAAASNNRSNITQPYQYSDRRAPLDADDREDTETSANAAAVVDKYTFFTPRAAAENPFDSSTSSGSGGSEEGEYEDEDGTNTNPNGTETGEEGGGHLCDNDEEAELPVVPATSEAGVADASRRIRSDSSSEAARGDDDRAAAATAAAAGAVGPSRDVSPPATEVTAIAHGLSSTTGAPQHATAAPDSGHRPPSGRPPSGSSPLLRLWPATTDSNGRVITGGAAALPPTSAAAAASGTPNQTSLRFLSAVSAAGGPSPSAWLRPRRQGLGSGNSAQHQRPGARGSGGGQQRQGGDDDVSPVKNASVSLGGGTASVVFGTTAGSGNSTSGGGGGRNALTFLNNNNNAGSQWRGGSAGGGGGGGSLPHNPLAGTMTMRMEESEARAGARALDSNWRRHPRRGPAQLARTGAAPPLPLGGQRPGTAASSSATPHGSPLGDFPGNQPLSHTWSGSDGAAAARPGRLRASKSRRADDDDTFYSDLGKLLGARPSHGAGAAVIVEVGDGGGGAQPDARQPQSQTISQQQQQQRQQKLKLTQREPLPFMRPATASSNNSSGSPWSSPVMAPSSAHGAGSAAATPGSGASAGSNVAALLSSPPKKKKNIYEILPS